MRIQAAQPRPTDVELDGYACRTVLAATELPAVYGGRPWHSCLLDCRQIQGFVAHFTCPCWPDLPATPLGDSK